jgi:hypothetical protein
MYLWKFVLANINITRICIITLSILTEWISWLDIIHFLLWNECFFYFHFNCQCQISWNHDFWLSFIQSSSVTLYLWLFICNLFICDSSSVISSSVTLHLRLFICDSLSVTLYLWLFICDSLSVTLHLWLFICDSSSVISSSVISSSVTLHLWSQYIWYMAWLEMWPFSWSVLISGELLYHIEKNSQVSVMGVKHHYQQHLVT